MTDAGAVDFSRLGPAPGARMAVFGGAGGIGQHLVRAALDTGLEVAVIDLPVSLERHPPPQGVAAIGADARDAGQIEAAFADLGSRWSALDVFVHLAGFSPGPTPVEDIEPEVWDEVIDVNLRSVYLTARAALPLLRRAENGAIVAAASGLATLVEKGVAPYSASKAGLIALIKVLAKENAPHIRANAIAPGAVDTPFLSGGTGRAERGNRESFVDQLSETGLLQTIPFGRIAVVDDVVGPILLLAGPAARYMTGQVLYVNSGRLMP